MSDAPYAVEDLERIVGVSARTIHFWVQSGLLKGPGAGRGARYTDEHLLRLRAIQKLKSEGKSLSEIRRALRGESLATLREAVENAPRKEEVSAKELLQRWLKGRPSVAAAPADAPRALARDTLVPRHPAAAAPSKSVWERIPLAPGVELHVERPLSRPSHDLAEEVVALARRRSQEPAR